MAFVQVKNTLQTWRIAAFIVAFFSSFFSYSIDFTLLSGYPPSPITVPIISNTSLDYYDSLYIGSNIGSVDATGDCQLAYPEVENGTLRNVSGRVDLIGDNGEGGSKSYSLICMYEGWNSYGGWHKVYDSEATLVGFTVNQVVGYECPSETRPSFTYYVSGESGQMGLCYNPADMQHQLDEQNRLERNQDYCESLVLDSGNNSSSNACYSAYNGASCSVSQVTVGDATYYRGTGNEVLGCGSSDDPPFDSSGTGDSNDECVYSGGTNYCAANREQHCSTTNGTQICDDGCIDDGTTVMCDASRHNDVGEGESNVHDGNGTCSVIAASTSRGFCEDMGGTWDSTQDATEAACPSGTGSCSTPTAGLCGACLDTGGVWTPDTAVPTSPEQTATIEVAALVRRGNEMLTAIEHGQRQTTGTTVSTIKSGNNRIVAALEDLTAITSATSVADPEPEEETFTTTTGEVDKTVFNTLFDAASTASLKAENVAKELEIKNLKNTIINEGRSLFTISATGSGYEARSLVMSSGSYDSSFSRFGFFFVLLAAPIMLAATVKSAQIILGKNS